MKMIEFKFRSTWHPLVPTITGVGFHGLLPNNTISKPIYPTHELPQFYPYPWWTLVIPVVYNLHLDFLNCILVSSSEIYQISYMFWFSWVLEALTFFQIMLIVIFHLPVKIYKLDKTNWYIKFGNKNNNKQY